MSNQRQPVRTQNPGHDQGATRHKVLKTHMDGTVMYKAKQTPPHYRTCRNAKQAADLIKKGLIEAASTTEGPAKNLGVSKGVGAQLMQRVLGTKVAPGQRPTPTPARVVENPPMNKIIENMKRTAPATPKTPGQ
jgi:hypothetical protein